MIDKPIMELLHITMDTPLDISTDGKNLIVSPVTDPVRAKEFKAAFKRVLARHGKTFEKLAKRKSRLFSPLPRSWSVEVQRISMHRCRASRITPAPLGLSLSMSVGDL